MGSVWDYLRGGEAQLYLRAAGVEIGEDGEVNLDRVLERSKELAQTAEGAAVLRAAQERLVDLLAQLQTSEPGVPPPADSTLALLERTAQGRELLAWGRERLATAAQNPDALQSILVAIDPALLDGLGEWGRRVASGDQEAALQEASERCLDFLHSEGVLKKLQELGVEVDAEGSVRLEQVLEKSQELAASEEGCAILRHVQKQALELLPSLESAAGGLGLTRERQVACAEHLERSQHGRQLLDWGREQLAAVEQDPDVLSKWVAELNGSTARQIGDYGSQLLSNDAAERHRLLAAVRDECVAFLQEQLQLLDVPPLEGENEVGTKYSVANVDLSSFTLDKENVTIQLMQPPEMSAARSQSLHGGDPPDSEAPPGDGAPGGKAAQASVEAVECQQTSLRAEFAECYGVPPKPEFAPPPRAPAACDPADDSQLDGHCVAFSDSQVEPPTLPDGGEVNGEGEGDASAGELLRVSAEKMTVDVPDLRWSYEQTRFPYLRGHGAASAVIRGGSVHLALRLERTELKGKEVPCLGLGSCGVKAESLQLTFRESRLSKLYNLLAGMFQETTKDSILSALEEALNSNIAALLQPLNEYLRPHSAYLLACSGIPLEALPEARQVASFADQSVTEEQVEQALEDVCEG